jgi:hypothetical protein
MSKHYRMTDFQKPDGIRLHLLKSHIKRPAREADYTPPPNAEVKECVELYFDSPIRLHGVVLRDDFTFALKVIHLSLNISKLQYKYIISIYVRKYSRIYQERRIKR